MLLLTLADLYTRRAGLQGLF